jgi:hypothetical protein
MSNTLQTSTLVGNQALELLRNKLVIGKAANRHFEDLFTSKEFTTGNTIDIRRPTYFTQQSGPSITPQPIIQRIQPLTITDYISVPFSFTSQELALFLYDNKKRSRSELESKSVKIDNLIEPAIVKVAEQIESNVAAESLTKTNYFTGTPGVLVNSAATIGQARALMNQLGIPYEKRFCFVSHQTEAAIQASLNNNFNRDYSNPILKRGYMGYLSEFEFAASTYVTKHVSGTGGGGSVVNGFIASGTTVGTTTSGNSLTITGLPASTPGTFLKGDVIYVLGADSWNMPGAVDAQIPVQLLVTADAGTTSGGGQVTIAVSIAGQGMISDPTNPYQNISIPIPASSAVFLAATHTTNLCMMRDALCLAVPPLAELDPRSVGTERVTDNESGMSIRFTHGADITNDLNIQRFDVIMGVSFFPEYAIRLLG